MGKVHKTESKFGDKIDISKAAIPSVGRVGGCRCNEASFDARFICSGVLRDLIGSIWAPIFLLRAANEWKILEYSTLLPPSTMLHKELDTLQDIDTSAW